MNEIHHEERDVLTGWGDLAERLAGYLAEMTDDQDHLILETPEPPTEGTSPYVQVCRSQAGLRLEASGNRVLAEQFRLTQEQLLLLAERQGWHLPDAEEGDPNLWLELDDEDAPDLLASIACEVLSDFFHVPFPEFLTVQAWGPAAVHVVDLGLPKTGPVPVDVVDRPATADDIEPPLEWAEAASDHDHLVEIVRTVLTRGLDAAPTQDDDGDFVFNHEGHSIFVRTGKEMPVVDIFTRLVHDVHSRKQASIEVNLLNRQHPMVKFVLLERSIIQVLAIPAAPLAHHHISGLVPYFITIRDAVIDDLVLRTQGRNG